MLLCWATKIHAQDTNRKVYFANGIRNGWVDSNSAVIWTRATRHPEMNFDGKKFVVPRGPERNRLRNSDDPQLQLQSQLPEGAKLDEMEGAVPGIEATLYLEFWPVGQRDQSRRVGARKAETENDFAVQWRLTRLISDTRYQMQIGFVDDQGKRQPGVSGFFRTAPEKSQRRSIRFCLTTCHDYPRRDGGKQGHLIYPSMGKLSPDFMVHAGDVEYYDQPYPLAWTIPLMRFHWNRFFALPANREFYRNHSTYFMKDDHDTLKNDCWPGQKYGSVTFEQGRDLFNREQFPANDKPYKTIRWGKDLQIWLVEGRDFRSPNRMPDGPEKTIWGEQQKKWFFETVKNSDATFKILFSPTPLLGPDRGGKRDNHANQNFKHEGDQLREFISKQENMLIMCGDRHWQYVTHLKDSNLWEFGCGPGSEHHQLGWKKGDLRDQHEFLRVAGGFLSGELKIENEQPVLYVRHHKVDGRVVNEVAFGK